MPMHSSNAKVLVVAATLLSLAHAASARAGGYPAPAAHGHGLTDRIAAQRERVNFDFAWRFHYGDPGLPNRQCGKIEKGVNYGTGGERHGGVADAATCCALCANASACIAWDWDPSSNDCWTKPDATGPVSADRYSGTIPPPPPSSLPISTQYDDSAWQLVDAPHDALLHGEYSESNDPKMGFLPRGVAWYRKHFTLPADWQGSAVYVYFEGVYHVTTAWLNGVPLTGPGPGMTNGTHLAGYTSFSLRLDTAPGVVWGGSNVLAVYVDATFGSEWWYTGGGLFRHQYLVRVNQTANLGPSGGNVFAFGTKISGISKDGAGGLEAAHATLHCAATVHSDAAAAAELGAGPAQVTVQYSLSDADGSPVATGTSPSVAIPPAGTDSIALNASIPVPNAKLWSVYRPYLYKLVATVVDAATGSVYDTVDTTIGFRTINFTATEGLLLNGEHVKARGSCDHSNFGGGGAALPDRVNLFRAQALRAVGINAWRMAHNPPIPARLDITDALGMMVMDENRNYGGAHGQGGPSEQTNVQQVADMGDLVVRDRNRASVVIWSFCNEVGCDNETAAKAFRAISYADDGTRPVTQNHLGTDLSTDYLDVQGFSHKSGDVFDAFHKSHPTKPTMATECCSCLSQRGIDEDTCPNPRPSSCTEGCHIDCNGAYSGNDTAGMFYNDEISQCTGTQIAESDSRGYVSGTFIWSGSQYLGESRGWPQTTKARGIVNDIAGFPMASAGWLRSWWLANITGDDAGKPNLKDSPAFVVSIAETWGAPRGAASNNGYRLIHAYTNAPWVALLLNGKPAEGGEKQQMPFFGTATFPNVTYAPGNLTAVVYDDSGAVVATHSSISAGKAAAIRLSLDAPSPLTGTGSALVSDGEDTAMVRATIVDAAGVTVPDATNNVSFSIASGPGRIWALHSSSPNDHNPPGLSWSPAYMGLVRAFIRSSVDTATAEWHRARMAAIDDEAGSAGMATSRAATGPVASSSHAAIVLKASSPGLTGDELSIPVSNDLSQLPAAVAAVEGMGRRA